MLLTYVSYALLASQSFAAIVRSDTSMSIEADGKVKEFNVNTADTDTAVNTAQMVLAEVEDWAKSGGVPDGKNIFTIEKLAKDLRVALDANHDTEQKEVHEIYLKAFTTCNKNQENEMKRIAATTKVEVGKQRDKHAKCRNEEVVIYKDMQKKCKHLTTWLKETVEDTPKPEGSTDDEMVDYVEKMSGYWCGKGKVAEEKQKVCENRKKDHRDKKEICDGFQSQFELSFCTWKTEMNSVCNQHVQCYGDARDAYDAHVKSTRDDVAKWKTECIALEKIICYIDVWVDKNNSYTVAGGKDSDVKDSQLKKCQELKPDCSTMDIDFGVVPEQNECSLADVKDHPGTPEFKNKYAKWVEFVNEPTACVGETSDPFANPHEEEGY